MYRRFLNNNDYLGIITAEALAQLTRGNDERFIQAEESAEMSIIEYLSENYEIEKELAKGKYIAGYDRRITYPVGVHIYFGGKICEVIRSISGYRQPALQPYWEEAADISDSTVLPNYSQFETYYPGQAEMIADFWMPNKSWAGCDVRDPSARVLANYGDSGK